MSLPLVTLFAFLIALCSAARTTTTTTTSTLHRTSTTTIYPSATLTTYTKSPWADDHAFRFACVNSTDHWRRMYSAPPVRWNTSLVRDAQRWTDKCMFKHSGQGHGENLAIGFISPGEAIDAWAGENDVYDFSKDGFQGLTLHFTQLVWRGSTSIGCGRTFCDDAKDKRHGKRDERKGNWLFACEYDPPGNVGGQFKKNVHRQVWNGRDSSGVIWYKPDIEAGLIGAAAALQASRLRLLGCLASMALLFFGF